MAEAYVDLVAAAVRSKVEQGEATSDEKKWLSKYDHVDWRRRWCIREAWLVCRCFREVSLRGAFLHNLDMLQIWIYVSVSDVWAKERNLLAASQLKMV